MAQIIVVDRDGQHHEIEGKTDLSVMEVIRDAGLPIEAQCGGCASCATCHVYVEEDWMKRLEPRSDLEEDMLDLADGLRETSRLSCQIPFTDALDGLKVELAPE